MRLEEAQRALNDTKREFTRFYQQAIALKAKVGELTPERRAEYESELWEYRLKVTIAQDLIARGTFCKETLDMLVAVPSRMREFILEKISTEDGKKTLVSWYLEDSIETLPEIDKSVSLDWEQILLIEQLL